MKGYKKYFGDDATHKKINCRLISIFSAPNFKDEMGNLASVLHLSDQEDEFNKNDDYPFYLNVFDKSQERKYPANDE